MANESGFASVGAALRARREAEGLSLDEVADRTRVPRRHLSAIEDSDFATLPAAPYAVGFVKSYARLLGVPAEETGREFRAELGAFQDKRPQQQAFEPADPARVPPRWLAVVAALVAVLIAVGYGLWASGRLGGESDEQRQALAANVAADQPAAAPARRQAPPPPSSSAPVVAGGPVTIIATAPAWLRITDGDKRLYLGVMKAGDRYQVPADAGAPVIRTAAAQALTVSVGTTVLPPLAPPSTLIKDVSLKPADLVARAQAAGPTAAAGVPAPPSDRAISAGSPGPSLGPQAASAPHP